MLHKEISGLATSMQLGNKQVIETIGTLKQRIVEVETELKAEIERVEEVYNEKLEPVLTTSAEHSTAIKDLETAMKKMSEVMKRMKEVQDRVSGQLARMTDKCLDLEARSRRQNLRIVGLREGKETGMDPWEFTANLLKQVFKLSEKPKVDVAHRVQRAHSRPGAPPRQIIVKLHDIAALEDIMKKIPFATNLMFEGETVRFFRDYPAEVAKKRALFTKTRLILKGIPNLRYGIIYPAKMSITYKDLERFFIDPEEAFKYAQELTKDIKG
ncbi:uncharacterized protein LOC116978134 [Amblyraja radiata]|uniref:uncharacterized protein LOC116978134 n=1 Tax=Amblyraja radiata TaxID=386614 RepID=UPI001401E6E3|nr:uncharacterized protein LOC116978134 [Amblyraja radiata]